MSCEYSLNFDNRFAQLPEAFFTQMAGEGFSQNPYFIHGNQKAAELIGISPDCFNEEQFAQYFSGNKNLPGAQPLAMVYSGHQFGVWAGQLGDGRALLLGQVRQNNQLWDVQLKGAGKTPYSRFGDGRAVLRSSIREYLCSEAMYGLGIPTTRGLCIIGTNEAVQRETLEPGAIITRIAETHIRFGHFEHFYHTQQDQYVKQLADYVIQNHFENLSYENWFAEVVKRTAVLMAQWQAVGFCHGVMNTDNMSITGLTLDYGPFGFMEAFDQNYICNHSDHQGRYSYKMQPTIGFWNLHALATALEPLVSMETAKEILKNYEPILLQKYQTLMAQKLGITNPTQQDMKLWQTLLQLMQEGNADYTLVFRTLSTLDTKEDTAPFTSLFHLEAEQAEKWLEEYMQQVDINNPERLALMKQINPKYILRNWVAETAIRAAEDDQDYTMIDNLLTILHAPYSEHEAFSDFAMPAPANMQNLCISCSS